MKNKLFLLVGIGVACVLLSYMLVFVVRFDQVAVRASFGSADDSSVIKEAGFKFRLPWPFQQIYHYSTRTQLVETASNQILTEDGSSIIIRTYLAWRIEDPLKFYKTLREESAATEKLTSLLGSLSSQIGTVKFTDLVNTDPSKVKLAQVEKDLLDRLVADLAKLDYGITAEHAGIRRIVLPQAVTGKVFERMKSDRENRAASVRTRGTAQASAIVSDARSIRKSILSFANKHAEEIKTRGLTQAAEEYKVFAKDEQFAIYLRQMEALEKILKINTTFVIDANKVDEYSPFRLLVNEPGASAKPPLRP